MKPLRARYSKIDRVVADLLSEHGVSEPAVDVSKIAKRCGATIRLERFNNEVSSLLLRDGSHSIIGVEKTQSRARQRCTIAHELGHLLLHDGEELRVDRKFRLNLRSPESSTAEDVEEVEANAFAAGLLMPILFLQRDFDEFWIDIDDEEQIRDLAERYEVSSQAMTIRLMNLNSLGKL
jgi:Zn-dependent peptidase ImmA (M78 family)